MIDVHQPHDDADPHDHFAQPLSELIDLLTQGGLLFLFLGLHHSLLDLAYLRLHARANHQRFADAVGYRGACEEHVSLLRENSIGLCTDVGILDDIQKIKVPSKLCDSRLSERSPPLGESQSLRKEYDNLQAPCHQCITK